MSAAQEHFDAAASRWVVRRNLGLDPAERVELAAWLAADLRHAAAFDRLSAVSLALERARRSGAADEIATDLGRRQRRRSRRRVAAAAGLALAVAAGLAFRPRGQPAPEAVARTPSTFESVRRLSDGTIVEVNGDADVAVDYDASVRRIVLRRGEALFRVAKDPTRPFIVRAGNVDVQALGTAFDVRLDPRTVEVVVTEGKVKLDGHSAPLVAGDCARVDRGRATAVQVVRIDPRSFEDELAEHRQRIEFDGIELGEAVAQLNRHNAVRIALGDEGLASLRLSGTFPANDPPTFARLVAETFGLEQSPGETLIVLRR